MLRRSLVALLAALALPASAHADPVIDERFDGGALPAGVDAGRGRLERRGRAPRGPLDFRSGQLSRLTFGPHLDNYRFEVTLRFESVIDGARWTALALDMPAGGAPPWWQAALRSNTTAANGLEFAQRRRTTPGTCRRPPQRRPPRASGRDVRVGSTSRAPRRATSSTARW